MACRLLGAKPLSEQILEYLNRNVYIFIQENAFENIWKMAAILSRPQYVNSFEEIYRFQGSIPEAPFTNRV